MRRIVLMTALAGVAFLLVSVEPGRALDNPQPAKEGKPGFVHNVIFYLKKDTPPAKVEACIADCHKILGKITSVRGVWVGRPAQTATPELTVKDYQVGLMILFDNFEGLKAYNDDPAHMKFVETYLPSIEKVLVYDFANQAK
jgi:hypothetical protein